LSHSRILNQRIMKLLPSVLDGLVLDVACGYGYFGYQIRMEKKGHPTIIGVDIWKPYIKKIKKVRVYESLVIADVRFLPFRRKVFDSILACEILEHLPKEDGWKLLRELEEISKGIIIVSTPLGFLEQDTIHSNPHQKHVSAWRIEDLIKMGYNVQILDSRPLPKTLMLVDKVRRFIFNLPNPFKEIIAWKDVEGERDKASGR